MNFTYFGIHTTNADDDDNDDDDDDVVAAAGNRVGGKFVCYSSNTHTHT